MGKKKVSGDDLVLPKTDQPYPSQPVLSEGQQTEVDGIDHCHPTTAIFLYPSETPYLMHSLDVYPMDF